MAVIFLPFLMLILATNQRKEKRKEKRAHEHLLNDRSSMISLVGWAASSVLNGGPMQSADRSVNASTDQISKLRIWTIRISDALKRSPI